MAKTIIRLPKVKGRTGLARSTIYLRMAQKRFPKSIPLGGRAVGWVEDEIDDWVDQQIQLSRADQDEGK